MDSVKVGVIGFGTVGAGTVEILLKNRDVIRKRTGSDISIKKIADLDIDYDRGFPLDRDLLTTDAYELINDPDIDIIVELVGGTEKAREFILASMEQGKHIITANKALLAEHGKVLYKAAHENNVSIAFEASVCGGIPVLRALREGLSANNIRSIMGILNGTSNYILTRMTQDGVSYDEAVRDAMKLGYAEDPPTLDVGGIDAAHKLAILISLSFGRPVSFDDIFMEGIDRLTPEDIQFSGEFGYCIKLLAVARDLGDKVEARVHPTMIPEGHIMANVNDAFNAIYIEGDFVGPNLYYGLGAGREATGSAVVSDIISLARQMKHGVSIFIPPLAHAEITDENIAIQPMEELECAYYFRFSAYDKPGVLSKISGILGEHGISISSVIQKGREIAGSVPIVMLTHEARESNVLKALDLIDKLNIVTGKTMMIRVEER